MIFTNLLLCIKKILSLNHECFMSDAEVNLIYREIGVWIAHKSFHHHNFFKTKIRNGGIFIVERNFHRSNKKSIGHKILMIVEDCIRIKQFVQQSFLNQIFKNIFSNFPFLTLSNFNQNLNKQNQNFTLSELHIILYIPKLYLRFFRLCRSS